MNLLPRLSASRWMTGERALAYRNVLLVVFPSLTIILLLASRNGLGPYGRPIGTDFVSFWTASEIALSGHPSLVYNVARHWAAQITLFGDPRLHYTAFFYPPVFLLVCFPLALMPYFWALVTWLAVTGYLCWRALERLAPGFGLWFLAFPAVWLNVLHGQNAFLATALFAYAILKVENRPMFAGFLFGCLIFKPHLFLLLPIGLIAAGYWRILCTAAATAIILCLISLGVLGADTWAAFFSAEPLAKAALEQGLVGYDKMQSVFAAIRLLGGDVWSAYVVQIAALVTAGAAVICVCRRISFTNGAAAFAVTASLLVTPFLLVYDLVLLAIPLAWVYRRCRMEGFDGFDKAVLLATFILPLLGPPLGHFLCLPITPLEIMALMGVVSRHALSQNPAAQILTPRSRNEPSC